MTLRRVIPFEVKPHYFGEDGIGGDPYPCDCASWDFCPHSSSIQDWFARQEAAWQQRRDPAPSSVTGEK